MKPKALRNPAMARGNDGLLRREMVDAGREVVLDPLAELVWDFSDGSRSFEDLAQAAGRALDRVVNKEEVFSALDFLADAGLIEERVAPPAAEGKVSRRALLVQLAPVVGAGACMMLGASARAGGFFQKDHVQREEYGEQVQKSMETADKEVATKLSISKRRGNESAAEGTNREAQKDWERVWSEEHKGRIDHTGKYAVAPDHPLVGKWKCVTVDGRPVIVLSTGTEGTFVWTVSSRGILETELSSISYDSKTQDNWKYTSTGPRAGFLEEFLGDLASRGDIRWLTTGNEFDYTTTFDPNPYSKTGIRLRFVRDTYWREGIRSEFHDKELDRIGDDRNNRDSQPSERTPGQDYEHAAPRLAPKAWAQKLYDRLDQLYANRDPNGILRFYDSGFYLTDERGNEAFPEFRKQLEQNLTNPRHRGFDRRTIVEDVEVQADRIIVHYKSEIFFEFHDQRGRWVPEISKRRALAIWKKKGGEWKIVWLNIVPTAAQVDPRWEEERRPR